MRGRGPKPKRIVVVDPDASAVVKEIFSLFVAYQSISAVVKWLNSVRETIPKIGKGRWSLQSVRRILTNPKYIGKWDYGSTTTVRDTHGARKQIPARTDQHII